MSISENKGMPLDDEEMQDVNGGLILNCRPRGEKTVYKGNKPDARNTVFKNDDKPDAIKLGGSKKKPKTVSGDFNSGAC